MLAYKIEGNRATIFSGDLLEGVTKFEFVTGSQIIIVKRYDNIEYIGTGEDEELVPSVLKKKSFYGSTTYFVNKDEFKELAWRLQAGSKAIIK